MRRLTEITRSDDVELTERVRVLRGDECVAAISDADLECLHVVAGAGHRGRARGLGTGFCELAAACRRQAL